MRDSLLATLEPLVSPPLPSRDAITVVNNSLGGNAPTRPVATARYQTEYRPLPTKEGGLLRIAESSKKRKHAPEPSRAERRYRDSGGEGDSEMSGDGSSSGDSISSQAPVYKKRQRTSRIATRSSTRIPSAGGASTSEDQMDVGPSPGDTPSVEEGITLTDSNHAGKKDLVATNPHASADTDAPVATNTNTPVVTDTEDPVATNAHNPVTANARNPTNADVDDSATGAEDPTVTSSDNPTTMGAGLSTIAHSAFSPTSFDDIEEANIPAFLLRHGKGKREVNIFDYLSKVKDPRFRQAFSHYLHFEINKPKAAGSLPTIKRPAEIGQWSSRARPASLPEYTKGGRSLTHFADSVFEWWALIQPPWRKFKRGKVSREVQGGWDALCATGINGLLNVVVLAYWWVRILEEDKPEDSVRAEYEVFIEDVAWVLSNLASTYA